MKWFSLGLWGAVAAVCASVPVWAADAPDDRNPYRVDVRVDHKERLFHTVGSFHVPLTPCESYRFLTDYEAVKLISGVIDSRATRIDERHVQVERWAEDRVLLFKLKLHAIIDYTERPYQGIDFAQREGDARVYTGQWRITPDEDGSVFRYDGRFEPDSSLPLAVMESTFQSRTRDRFGEMARNAAQRKGKPVAACD